LGFAFFKVSSAILCRSKGACLPKQTALLGQTSPFELSSAAFSLTVPLPPRVFPKHQAPSPSQAKDSLLELFHLVERLTALKDVENARPMF
jgi:hypothetical protein